MILDSVSSRPLNLKLQLQLFDFEQRRISKSLRFNLLGLRSNFGGFQSRFFSLLLLLICNDAGSRSFDPVVKKIRIADLNRLRYQQELSAELRSQ